MPRKSESDRKKGGATLVVSAEIFKQVYDSPLSLPGKDRWVTSDADVRTIEKLIWMDPTHDRRTTVGQPAIATLQEMWTRTSWLDIVSSALSQTHQKECWSSDTGRAKVRQRLRCREPSRISSVSMQNPDY